MKINFIDLQAQYKKYKDEIDSELESVLNSSTYIMGPQVRELENELADFAGVEHAIGCSSGTDALLLAMMALEIGPGDEVITTPFTFIATAEAIAFLGAKPVFVDIDERTYNIDVSKIEDVITDKTKAIVPVSLFGQMSDMDAIDSLAKKHNLYVIEDAAQSFGAEYKGKKSCSVSDIGCTSFFPAKPLGCYGDGGAVFTNNTELAEKIRILLNHGQTDRYVHEYIGMNGRLDSIQAAVLRVKLKHYSHEIEERNSIASKYSENLKNVVTPHVDEQNMSVWAQYCIRAKDREKVIQRCTQAGIPTAIYYPIPLHLQKVFSNLGYKEGDFPIAEAVSRDIMALPMSAFLAEEQQDYIIGVLNGE